MFKPRLRIPRTSGLLRSAQSTIPRAESSSPFAVANHHHHHHHHHHHQQRSLHATPVRRDNAIRQHEVPELYESWHNDGVPGLLSKPAFHIAWTGQQRWLLENLNQKIANTEYQQLPVKKIAIQTSREPDLADTFNFASMAHNNEFFFTGIAPTGGSDPSEHLPDQLREELEQSFGSMETLQRELMLTANAMFGPGYVWLVRQDDKLYQRSVGQYRILPTYLAGSPYPGAHWRRQGTDMNNVAGLTDQSGDKVKNYFDSQNHYNSRTPLHGSGSMFQEDQLKKSPGGAELTPVLCVSTWEHVWLTDYGPGGKFDFLLNWWRVIHWGRVWERSQPTLGAGRPLSTTVNPAILRKQMPAQS